jgi:hypothetical protein
VRARDALGASLKGASRSTGRAQLVALRLEQLPNITRNSLESLSSVPIVDVDAALLELLVVARVKAGRLRGPAPGPALPGSLSLQGSGEPLAKVLSGWR